MKHRGGSPTGGSHHCFSWSPVERPCYRKGEPGLLFHLILSSGFPPSSVFQSSQCLRNLRPSCFGKWVPSLWTIMVSYEWPCMPRDIIAMLPKGHGMPAAPLKCTRSRTPRTFAWLQCFIDASAHLWKTLHESGCWTDYHLETRPMIWI